MAKVKYESKLERVPLDKIQPYWRNPRDNNPEAIEKVMESIKQYGYQVPIVVDKKYVIIAGHTRYKALQQLDYQEEIPVLVSDMTGKKAKEFRVVDNKTSEYSNWDIEALTLELKEFVNPETVESFFPEIDLESGFKDIDFEIGDDEVKDRQEELEGQFEKRSEERENALLEIMCPNCLEKFEMMRSDILNNRHLEKGFDE